MTETMTGSPARTPFADRIVARADLLAGRARIVANQRLGLLVLVWRVLAATWRGSVQARRRWWTWVRAAELNDKVRKDEGIGSHQYRKGERRARIALSIAAALGAAVVALVAVVFLGALVVGLPALLAGGGAAARAGRRDGEKLTIAARKPGRATQDSVTEALRAAGVIGKTEVLRFVTPVTRDPDGHAWAAVVDLPAGAEAELAMKAKGSIASALAVDEIRLDLSRIRGDTGHAGRLSIWCAGSDPYAAKPARWPLLDEAEWDFWRAFPFGLDPRSRAVAVSMLWTHLLIGSIPRIGKSFAARLVTCAAALDPYVRLVVFDGKGGTDWKALSRVAWRWGKGVRPATVERLAAVLAGLVEEMNDRYDRLDSYPPEDVPEGKITPAISRDPDAGMPLILVTIDEVHRYLESKEHGEAILASLVELAKVGPAVGIMILLATQKPDSTVLPTELRDVLGTRFALKTMTWQASDTILGAGSYKAGLDASKFLRSHKGVGILLGADDESATEEPITVRTYLLDAVGARAVCERGRQLRIDAGTLEGDAAGDSDALGPEISQERRPLPRLIHDAMGDAEQLLSAELCARLKAAGLDLDQTALADQLRPYDIQPTWVRTADGRGRGYRRADIEAAIAP